MEFFIFKVRSVGPKKERRKSAYGHILLRDDLGRKIPGNLCTEDKGRQARGANLYLKILPDQKQTNARFFLMVDAFIKEISNVCKCIPVQYACIRLLWI